MTEQLLIQKTVDFAKEKMKGESSGHDWWHVYRVWQTAKRIADSESSANRLVVELAALLHDIDDWKFAGPEAGPQAAREWLTECGVEPGVIQKVEKIIRGEISQTGDVLKEAKAMIEYKIVHDADNIDAIGAIGIARAFATGAKFNEVFYDPDIPPPKHNSVQEYIAAKGKGGRTVINHFYEKLLTIKKLIETPKGKAIAEHRHRYMEAYLEEFYKEWEGKV